MRSFTTPALPIFLPPIPLPTSAQLSPHSGLLTMLPWFCHAIPPAWSPFLSPSFAWPNPTSLSSQLRNHHLLKAFSDTPSPSLILCFLTTSQMVILCYLSIYPLRSGTLPLPVGHQSPFLCLAGLNPQQCLVVTVKGVSLILEIINKNKLPVRNQNKTKQANPRYTLMPSLHIQLHCNLGRMVFGPLIVKRNIFLY